MPKRANNSGMGDPDKAEVTTYAYGWLITPHDSQNTIFFKNVYLAKPPQYAYRDARWNIIIPDKLVTCAVRKMWIDKAVELHLKRKKEQLKAAQADHIKSLPLPPDLPKIGCVGHDCEYCKELHKAASAFAEAWDQFIKRGHAHG